MWTISEAQGARTTLHAQGGQAVLEFVHALPALFIGYMIERDAEGPARQVIREQLTNSESLARYARLLRESKSLEREQQLASATANRMAAERSEVLTLAEPGCGERAADLDRQLADLSARRDRARSAAAAVEKPIAEARKAAVAEFAAAARLVNEAMLQRFMDRRPAILGRLTAAVQTLLDELAAADAIAMRAMVGSLGGESTATVDALAGELAADTPVSPKPAVA